MKVFHRKQLPHDIPLWVDPYKESYFISINCAERGRNQIALAEMSDRIFETVRFRKKQNLWWPHVFLLMPDHLHALLSFPPGPQPVRRRMSKWKEWTAKTLDIQWQRDFFEHRIRNEASFREKEDYILNNPVRWGLVKRPEEWPFVYFGDADR